MTIGAVVKHLIRDQELAGSTPASTKSCVLKQDTFATLLRPPPKGRFGQRSRRNSYDFALSVREGEDDFALFFGDFRNFRFCLHR